MRRYATVDARVPGRAPFSGPGRFAALMTILAIVLTVVSLVSVSVGAVAIDVGGVWRVVGARLVGSVADVDPVVDRIVWTVRGTPARSGRNSAPGTASGPG